MCVCVCVCVCVSECVCVCVCEGVCVCGGGGGDVHACMSQTPTTTYHGVRYYSICRDGTDKNGHGM